MGDRSNIEWCDATWNPLVGCTRVSPGCSNCYAERDALRLASNPRAEVSGLYRRTVRRASDGSPRWTGVVNLATERLEQPLRWRNPRRVFVNSMSDLFHESVPDEWVDRVFAAMALAPRHTFQVLTKRAARMRAYLTNPDVQARIVAAADVLWHAHAQSDARGFRLVENRFARIGEPVWVLESFTAWPLPHVWLLTSVETQQAADERIPELLAAPAAVRGVSCEPLLGPIQLYDDDWTFTDYLRGVERCQGSKRPLPGKLDWVIVGGESGPRARPMHPQWARDVRDQCATAGVAFFFKQWGTWVPAADGEPGAEVVWIYPEMGDRACVARAGDPVSMRRVKSKRAHALDGVEHRAFPAEGAAP